MNNQTDKMYNDLDNMNDWMQECLSEPDAKGIIQAVFELAEQVLRLRYDLKK